MTHGSNGARAGCICEICTQAKNEAARERRGRPRKFKPLDLEPRYLVTEGPACVHPKVDPEWFFLVQPNLDLTMPEVVLTVQMTNRLRTANAKAVCAGCPIRTECLEGNLTAEYGIFGGLTAPERHKVAIQRGITWPADEDYVDEPAVMRAISGEADHELRVADKREAARRLLRSGWTWVEVQDHLGVGKELLQGVVERMRAA